MKKQFFLLAILVVLSMTAAIAQPRAIGIRLGYGADFSYQHGVGESNMVNLEIGLASFNGIEAAVTYDWIFPFSSWTGNGSWNWNIGVGAGAGFYGFKGNLSGFAGVAGRIGVEYNFSFPLQLSLDWRPVIGPGFNYGYWRGNKPVVFNTDGLYAGAIALGVRYNF